MTSSGIWCGSHQHTRSSGKVEDFTKAYVTWEVPQSRAILCTSRLSRGCSGSCALCLSCVSLRHSVEPGIRELICVRSCSPPSRSSRVFLQSQGRSSFLTHRCVFCGVPQLSYRHPLRGSRRRHTLCLIHLPPVLLLCVFGPTFQSLVVVAVCASKSFSVRRSSKLPRHSQLIRPELSSNLSQSSFGRLRQDSVPVSWVEHPYS